MAHQLQATLDTILEKVAILEGRFDKLLTQSLCQLSETAHAKEGEINVEVGVFTGRGGEGRGREEGNEEEKTIG